VAGVVAGAAGTGTRPVGMLHRITRAPFSTWVST
jgi:hypothetical protein